MATIQKDKQNKVCLEETQERRNKKNEKIKKEFQRSSREKGITLVALVITIIILIILATVTINAVFGDNGLIKQAEYARDLSANSTEAEYEGMNSLYDEFTNVMIEDGEIPVEPLGPITVAEAKESGTEFKEKTTIKDEHGNEITVPGGFKIPKDSGDTVQQGIVIEDVSASTDENVQGSQYVWIPVGTFVKDDGTESSKIKLGRYTFNTIDGTPNLEQAAYTEENENNYTSEVIICITNGSIYREYIEVPNYRDGESNSLNATARNLDEFVESVKNNGGYYISRYEASYACGAETTTNVGDYSNCKAASKISISYSEESMLYEAGTLWNCITQPNSSKVAINTYSDSTNVKSDLINSYAWDTAIVYIQEAGYANYANQKGKDIYTSMSNTGNLADGVKDEVCKINNIASNITEWTTEYCNNVDEYGQSSCVSRGGFYNSDNFKPAYHGYNLSTYTNSSVGFRLNLYF